MFIPQTPRIFFIMLDTGTESISVFLFLWWSLRWWEGGPQGKLTSVSKILADTGVMRIKKPGSWV